MKQSKKKQILDLLRAGPKTSWELTQMAKTARYGGRIMELRVEGYEIIHEMRRLERTDGVVVQHIYRLISEPLLPGV